MEMRNTFLEQIALYVVIKSRLFSTKCDAKHLQNVSLGDTWIQTFFSFLAPNTRMVLHSYRFISLLTANCIIWRTVMAQKRENDATVQFRIDFTATDWPGVEKDIFWNGGRPLSPAFYCITPYWKFKFSGLWDLSSWNSAPGWVKTNTSLFYDLQLQVVQDELLLCSSVSTIHVFYVNNPISKSL